MKESFIISCTIVFGIIGIFWGYSAYENNKTMHKNYVLAQDAFRNSKFAEAEKLLDGNPPKDIAKDFYILKYNILMNSNKISQAKEVALELVKCDTHDAFSNYLLGLAYYNLGEKEETELYLKNAVKYGAENIDYKIYLANFYTNIAKYDEAINLFNEIKELVPGYEIAWDSIATIYENKGELEKALKYRKDAARRFKTNAYDSYMLAKLYKKMGKNELAAKYFAKTIRLDINNDSDAKTEYFKLTGKPYHSDQQFKNESIPFQNYKNLMIITASVNGYPGKFLVDTGATSCVIYKNFLKDKNINPTNLMGIVKSANNSVDIVPIVNANFTIGTSEFKNIKTSVLMSDNKAFDGIIGNDILKNTDFYIDRENKIITIRTIQ